VQETKAHVDQLLPEQVTPLNMKSYWTSAEKKGYSGVATFVKQESESVEHGIGLSKFDLEGRFVITRHGDITIYNIYFPNGARGGDRHEYKQEFLVKLNEDLKPKIAKGEQIIILGDYNVAPSESMYMTQLD